MMKYLYRKRLLVHYPFALYLRPVWPNGEAHLRVSKKILVDGQEGQTKSSREFSAFFFHDTLLLELGLRRIERGPEGRKTMGDLESRSMSLL